MEQEDSFWVPGQPLAQRLPWDPSLRPGWERHRKAKGTVGKRVGVGQWGVDAVNVSSPSSGVLVENSSSGVKKKKKRALSGGATEKSRLAPKT